MSTTDALAASWYLVTFVFFLLVLYALRWGAEWWMVSWLFMFIIQIAVHRRAVVMSRKNR